MAARTAPGLHGSARPGPGLCGPRRGPVSGDSRVSAGRAAPRRRGERRAGGAAGGLRGFGEGGSGGGSPALPRLANQKRGKAGTGSEPRAAAPGKGHKPLSELRDPVHHPPIPRLSLPGCTWPPAPGSSSPGRSRCAGPGGGSYFGPGCSIPPPWGWGKARSRSLLGNREGRGGQLQGPGCGALLPRAGDGFVSPREEVCGTELRGSLSLARYTSLSLPGAPGEGDPGGEREWVPSVRLMAAIASRPR